MLSSGSLLDNRYRLDERIATGGMGDVWRGTDVVLGRTIAVKVLRTAMLADPEFAARFYGEARMMAAFRHPGVVEVYDYSAGDRNDEDNCAYLVMAYVDGEPLSARLKDQGRLGVAETMSIVSQAAEALHAAHENGTVHRDVKPGNLIVKPNGTVILVDFGVARSAAVTSVTGLNAIVGTALYMAPEQVAKGNVTPATDVYALGAVAYHCIAGNPPFDGDNALQVALRHLEDEPEPLPDNLVPPAVRELISRAMAKQPEDRYSNAAEFAAAAQIAAGPLDWRSQTGTSMTNTTLRRPSLRSPVTGTTLGGTTFGGTSFGGAGVSSAGLSGAAMGAPGRTGTSMSGTSLTRPMSPAGPRPLLPGQRNLLEAAPPQQQAPPRKRGRSKNEIVVLLTVIGLFILAGGLALAIAMQNSSADADERPNTVIPGVSAEPTDEPDEPDEPTRTTATARPNNPPNTNTRKPSPSVSPSTSASPSATTPSTSPSPDPTTTPPSTEPTTTATGTTPVEPTEGGDEGGAAIIGIGSN